MNYPPALTDALRRRTLSLFVGADLPREITGLPSRADIARGLARRHAPDCPTLFQLYGEAKRPTSLARV